MSDKLYPIPDFDSDCDADSSDECSFTFNGKYFETDGTLAFLLREKIFVENHLKAVKRAIAMRKREMKKQAKKQSKKQ